VFPAFLARGVKILSALAGRPKTTICCVSKKIQTAYLSNTPRVLDFFASLHLAIFERSANFEFFNLGLPENI
jgi:hypothetical protein